MTKIAIDDGVPVPQNSRGDFSSYQFDKMKVGQSFAFPPGTESKHIAAALRHGRRKCKNATFISRTVEEDGKKVVRVWRSE